LIGIARHVVVTMEAVAFVSAVGVAPVVAVLIGALGVFCAMVDEWPARVGILGLGSRDNGANVAIAVQMITDFNI